jgi:hypothetical protein
MGQSSRQHGNQHAGPAMAITYPLSAMPDFVVV